MSISARERILLLTAIVPISIMPTLGSRDYDYYTITWLPYLAVLTILASALFSTKAMHRAYLILMTAPIFFSVSNAVIHRNDGANYSGDGIRETVQYLKENMAATDTIYVWGYRMDIYVYLQKLSAYPMANRLMIHPDPLITGEELRIKHEFPPYRETFLDLLTRTPPTFVVLFETDQGRGQSSTADRALHNSLEHDYREAFTIEKPDLRGIRSHFTVFKRVSDGSATAPAHPAKTS